MKAITIWQPWAWAILNLPPELAKDVENRSWPAPWMKGKAVMVHAGLKFDEDDAWDAIEVASGGRRPPPRALLTVGSMVGAVVLADFVYQSKSPWFCGPVGWVLGKRWPLRRPIPCRGAQGLWDVSEEVEADILAQLQPRRGKAA